MKTKIMLTIISGIIVFVLLQSGFLGNLFEHHNQVKKEMNKIPTPENWKLLSQADYSIQYPPDWEYQIDETGFILKGKTIVKKDNSKESISLLIHDFSGKNIDLDQMINRTPISINKLYTNSKIIDNEKISNGTQEYQKAVFIGDDEFNEQYCFFINEKGYMLTFTCDIDSSAIKQPLAESIFNTFTVKN